MKDRCTTHLAIHTLMNKMKAKTMRLTTVVWFCSLCMLSIDLMRAWVE